MQQGTEYDAAGNPVEGSVPAVVSGDGGLEPAAEACAQRVAERIHARNKDILWDYYEIGDDLNTACASRDDTYGQAIVKRAAELAECERTVFYRAREVAAKYSRERIEEIVAARQQCGWTWFRELMLIRDDEQRKAVEERIVSGEFKSGRALAGTVRQIRVALGELEASPHQFDVRGAFQRLTQNTAAAPAVAAGYMAEWINGVQWEAGIDETARENLRQIHDRTEELLQEVL